MFKKTIFLGLLGFLGAVPAFSQTSALYNFDTSGQLSTFFLNNDNVNNVTESTNGGIGNSGSIQLNPPADAVFVTKQGYVNGGDGAVYTLRAYVKSVGNSGYGGMGFTSVQNSQHSSFAAPASGIGVSVHGGGYEYNNDAENLSGNWSSANITRSTIGDLLNSGSPDKWYLFELKITDLPGNDFKLRTSVWSVRSDGTLIRTNPDAVDERTFSNPVMASAPVIYSYFSFGGDRIYNFDDYSINLEGSSLIEFGAPSITGSATLDAQVLDQINASANLLSAGSTSIIERGFVYSTTPDPTIANSKIVVSCTQPCTGTFTAQIPNLPNNTYYVRAFATNAGGTSYSTESIVNITQGSSGGGGQLMPSPLEKKDVIGSIEAWTASTNRTAHMALNRVEKRLDWLKRRQDVAQAKTSSQGIDIRFADPRLQQLFFEPVPRQAQEPEQIMLKAAHLAAAPQRAESTLVSVAETGVLNQFAAAREEALGATSPTFESESTLNDWSWWTMGTIMVGKRGEREGSSGLKVHADYLTFGVDRPTERFGVVGVSIMLGQDATDVGNLGSKVSNNSYSLALYNAYPLTKTFAVRSILGGTDFDFKTRRIDGSETLLGKRGAQQVFASVELRQDGYQFDLSRPVDMEWYVKADWVDTTLKQFAEEGGTFALLFEKQKVSSRHIRLGLDAKTKFQGEHGPIVPYMGLEYAANLSPASNADMRYVSETRMYRHILKKAYDSQWTLGVGVDYYIGKLRFGVSYERKHQRDYGYLDVISLGLEGQF